MSTRRTQPYRRRSPHRRHGAALDAMLRGRTAYGKNPADRRRGLIKGRRRRKRRSVRRYS